MTKLLRALLLIAALTFSSIAARGAGNDCWDPTNSACQVSNNFYGKFLTAYGMSCPGGKPGTDGGLHHRANLDPSVWGVYCRDQKQMHYWNDWHGGTAIHTNDGIFILYPWRCLKTHTDTNAGWPLFQLVSWERSTNGVVTTNKTWNFASSTNGNAIAVDLGNYDLTASGYVNATNITTNSWWVIMPVYPTTNSSLSPVPPSFVFNTNSVTTNSPATNPLFPPKINWPNTDFFSTWPGLFPNLPPWFGSTGTYGPKGADDFMKTGPGFARGTQQFGPGGNWVEFPVRFLEWTVVRVVEANTINGTWTHSGWLSFEQEGTNSFIVNATNSAKFYKVIYDYPSHPPY